MGRNLWVLVVCVLTAGSHAKVFDTSEEARRAAEEQLASMGQVVGSDSDLAMRTAERQAMALAVETVKDHPETQVDGIRVDLGQSDIAAQAVAQWPQQQAPELPAAVHDDQEQTRAAQIGPEDVPMARRGGSRSHSLKAYTGTSFLETSSKAVFETWDEARLAAEKELGAMGEVVGSDDDAAMRSAEKQAFELAVKTVGSHPDTQVDGIKVDLGRADPPAVPQAVSTVDEPQPLPHAASRSDEAPSDAEDARAVQTTTEDVPLARRGGLPHRSHGVLSGGVGTAGRATSFLQTATSTAAAPAMPAGLRSMRGYATDQHSSASHPINLLNPEWVYALLGAAIARGGNAPAGKYRGWAQYTIPPIFYYASRAHPLSTSS